MREERRWSIATIAWTVGFAVVAVAIATAAAWPIYQSPRAILVGAVGGLIGIAIAVAGSTFGWRWWIRGLAVVAAYLLLAVPLAIPSAMRSLASVPQGLLDAITGIVLGWKQLVTIEPPLADYQAVLVPLLIVTLVGGFLVTAIGLVGSRAGAAATAIAVVMLAFGIAFGAAGPGEPAVIAGFVLPGARFVLLGLGLLLAAVIWLVGRARMTRAQALARTATQESGATTVSKARDSTATIVRRNALAAGLVVVALVAGLVAAPAVADLAARDSVRDGIDPAIVLSRLESPLAGYRGWFAGDRFELPLLTVAEVPDGIDRLRIATLSNYDGTRFAIEASEAARFVRMPGTTPAADAVEVDITIGEGYSGVWVPLPGPITSSPQFTGERAVAIADGLFVAPGGSTAVAITSADGAGLEPGDRYSAWAPPAPATDRLLSTQGGEIGIDPDTLPELVQWVDGATIPRTGAGLLDAIAALRERGYLSHARAEDAGSSAWIAALQARGDYVFQPSLAGHSIARVDDLFADLNDQAEKVGDDGGDERLVAAVGDDEQFAAAAALVARYLGFESRVVIGVLLSTDESVPSVAACEVGACTGANVTAWIEVRDDVGQWVPIDVTPQFTSPPSQISVSEVPPKQPTTPEEPRSDVLDPPSATAVDDQSDEAPIDDPVPWYATLLTIARVVGSVLLALVLLVLPAIVMAVAKRTRRARRRGQASPEVAIVGAWEELIDLYADRGYDPPSTGTRTSTALAVRRPAATRLAVLADRAVFSQHPPTRDASDEAWGLVDGERKVLGAAVPPLDRIRSLLSPTSFLRRLDPRRPDRTARRPKRGREARS